MAQHGVSVAGGEPRSALPRWLVVSVTHVFVELVWELELVFIGYTTKIINQRQEFLL